MATIGQQFITAGNATFTIRGRESRYTYKVTRKDPEPGSRYTQPTYFVALLAGPDNTSDYTYLGILDPVTGYVRLTRGSRLTLQAPAVKAIQWALPRIWAGAQMPPSFGIWHEGRCGRCGRALTVPESIATGFGPECASVLGIDMQPADPNGQGSLLAERGGEFDGTLDYQEAATGTSARMKGFVTDNDETRFAGLFANRYEV